MCLCRAVAGARWPRSGPVSPVAKCGCFSVVSSPPAGRLHWVSLRRHVGRKVQYGPAQTGCVTLSKSLDLCGPRPPICSVIILTLGLSQAKDGNLLCELSGTQLLECALGPTVCTGKLRVYFSDISFQTEIPDLESGDGL